MSGRGKAWAAAALFLALSLLAAQEIETGLDYVDKSAENGTQVNWTKQTVRAVGSGVGPETLKDLARRKILAKRAAVLDGYRNLLEAVKGVRVTSSSMVQDLMLQNDTIKAEAEGMVKGAQEIAVNYTKEGLCEVTLEVHLDQLGEYMMSALSDAAAQRKDEYPAFDWVALQQELEQTKADLGQTKSRLQETRAELTTTRTDLARTGQDLEAVRKQNAETAAKLDLAQAQLQETGLKLVRAEEKLSYAELRTADLQAALDTAKAEAKATVGILDGLRAELAEGRVAAAVNEKELSRTRDFLAEKRKELDALSTELASFKAGTTPKAEIQQAIGEVKAIQAQSQEKVAELAETVQAADTPLPAARPVTEAAASQPIDQPYTGLLVDARGLGAKPAMAPSILSGKGFKLFGLTATHYLKGALGQAVRVSKAGSRPLVVKATRAVKGTDLVIDDKDIKLAASVLKQVKAGAMSILF